MGRDKVLGLSLAILLIGFAGAFCFRNEPFVENGLKLARAKILDEGIAKRPGPKPYVAEGKSDATPASKPTVTLGAIEAIEPVESPRTLHESSLHETPPAPSAKSPSDIADSQSVPKARFVSVEKERSTPDPVSTEPVAKPVGPSASATSILDKPLELSIRPSSRAFDSPDSLLEDSKTWHPAAGRDGCPAMTGISTELGETGDTTTDPITQAESPPAKTYTVRRGDTLSKIAQHFLGDSNRYRDIFEANRDQLQNQNARLKVGMTLRIPNDRLRSKRPPASNVSQSKPARATNPTGEVPRTRQVPARPIARTRDLSKQQPRENPSASRPEVEPEEPMGTPRFVPVTKGPFWRSRDDSGSTKSGSRDLSQRPPALEKKNRDSDDDTLGAAPQTKPKTDDNSSRGSDGSDGM